MRHISWQPALEVYAFIMNASSGVPSPVPERALASRKIIRNSRVGGKSFPRKNFDARLSHCFNGVAERRGAIKVSKISAKRTDGC